MINNKKPSNIAIIGASGAIGHAICTALQDNESTQAIDAFSRSDVKLDHPKVKQYRIDIESEDSISAAAREVANRKYQLILVTTGMLHDSRIMPEKNISDLSQEKFQRLFEVNTIGPALVAKHFLPLLDHQYQSVFAILSARVGSISDNRLGGWYAYRASKAALNMIIKNLSIEIKRRFPSDIVVGLHPGTVDSTLSQPFQASVPKEKLFTPEQSASYLLNVIQGLQPEDTGKILAWDVSVIEY